MGDINKGETMTMSPIVVKGKVLTGNSGGELGVRGWIAALDAGDGKVLWKAYSTGPDAEVLVGPEFRPFYESAGTLPNTRGHLAGWILDPQRNKPGTRMPPNPLKPDELQALLTYLQGLR